MGEHKGASIGGMGNSIIVQIIGSCPSVNAWNICKSEISENERCSSRDTDRLDIDQSDRALTGQNYDNVRMWSSRSSEKILKLT